MSSREGSGHVKAAIIGGIFTVIAACIGGAFLITNTLVANGFIIIGPSVQAGNPNAQPTAAQSTSITGGSLSGCLSGLAKGETRTVSPGTYIVGDIVIDGIRQHDRKEKEGTVAFFEREATAYAEWGASCYQGNISLLSQVIQGEYETGCDTGCIKVRSIIIRTDGQQEVQCHYPDGTVVTLQSNGSETWCP